MLNLNIELHLNNVNQHSTNNVLIEIKIQDHLYINDPNTLKIAVYDVNSIILY